MESKPIISLVFRSPAPGADPEVWDRFQKWSTEVYTPLSFKHPWMAAWDYYHIVNESPEYPSTGNITHSENIEDAIDYSTTPERKAIEEEMATWVKRGIVDYFWRKRYELIKSFRSDIGISLKESTIIENATIMHLEAYCFAPEEEEKYQKWLNDYGFNFFIPLFLKLNGLRGYDYFKVSESMSRENTKETNDPPYLSIAYFENMEAFQNYARSAELVVYQRGLRNVFPNGPIYKWYVQYKLVKSLRK